jgi:hypothetical protein
MFRLIATTRRGSAANIEAVWTHYATLDAARLASNALLKDERIVRIMIARNEMPPAFVEWA